MNLLTWLFRRRRIDRDLEAELRAHFDMAVADRVAAGEEPRAARLAAANEFGNELQAREGAREVWRGRAVAALVDVWQDVRFAVRMLVKNPGFSLVVITVLTLGIAGNAAIFSLFKGLALTPMPGVRDSSAIASLVARTIDGRGIGVSLLDYRYIKEHNRAFADLTASTSIFASVGRGADAERVVAELVTGDYFDALGVRAQLGRTLQASDDVAPGQHPVTVITDSLWRRYYGADPAIIGKTLFLNGQPLTIVGVADRDFSGTFVGMGIDVFAPVMMQPQLNPPSRLDARGVFMMTPVGHLQRGVTIAQAAAQQAVLASQLDREHPIANFTRRQDIVPIWQSPFGAQTYLLPAIGLLGGMGVLILLVVCANVANLMLIRGVSRRGELGVRLALGASRTRLMRLMLVENLVLAIPAALTGVALASAMLPWFLRGAASAAPSRIVLATHVDSYVLTFAVILSCASAIVFGFVPALRTSRVELTTVLNDLSPRVAAQGRLRSILVASQVAVSLVLLVVAGLVLRSYAAAQHADIGFEAANVTSMTINLQGAGYDEAKGKVAITRMLDSFAAEPAFRTTGVAMNVPMSLVDNSSRAITIEGYSPRSDEDMIFLYNIVSPQYFEALRIPLLAGRAFAPTDDNGAQLAVIVNETLARRFWHAPDQAIGKRIKSGTGQWHVVVGVAKDVKYSRLSEGPRPFVYYSLLQYYNPNLTIHARATGDLPYAMRRVREDLQQIDPAIPILRSMTLTEQARLALTIYELAAGSLTMFGVMTILLASIGIYGLVAYSVQQSTHEIGIRMAVGASRADVAWTFLRRGVVVSGTGAIIGLVLAASLSGAIRSLLYGVGVADLMAFAGGTMIVMVIALVASFVPAWRAAQTDPLLAIRQK